MPARHAANPYYQGPPSDHFDGVRFFMPGFRMRNCNSDLLRWTFSGERRRWPKGLSNPTPAPVSARTDGEGLRATFIGHSTVLIQTGGLNILTDPFFSERASPVQFAGPRRVRPPGVALEDLPAIDVVLVSHNHYDHMDLGAIRRLHELCEPRIVAPLGNGAILRKAHPHLRIEEADWWDRLSLGNGTSVHLTPALHWSKRTAFDRNMALWGAFVISGPGGTVYFAGDTGYGTGEHFREIRARFGPPRLALLPIGAYEPYWFMQPQHMNPADAVMAHRDLGAARSLAIHHGTVQLTDEAIHAPVDALAAALESQGLSAHLFRVLGAGGAWDLPALARPAPVAADVAAE